MDELVGTAEIARRLGCLRYQIVHDWRRRHRDFPAAVVVVGRLRLWRWDDVAEWAARTDHPRRRTDR